ncbi:CSC1-like protein HYP1 [Impatiens glandulifera]|uniref:CSC1-like protein HYP1 n=1 Tax=Impatiens glandulifera TaxID=253017 RepID=UPI001FB1A178|nr:CSC1-like protein HYP1 [Impatiens glandulifera]
MILSALLTSVGINLCLCLLFWTLYSILKKQPDNAAVYVPRLLAEGKCQENDEFNLERLIPSTNWVKRAWQITEDELLALSGLDGLVFMRVFVFSLRVFSLAGILGILVLLPINFLGDQLIIDFSDLSNRSLDSFSISNVNNGSNRLWVHFSAIYIFTAVVCYLLYSEYKSIAMKRVAYFQASKPLPEQFTILVRSVPVSPDSSISESVDKFFTEYHPSTYLSHTVVRQTDELQGLLKNSEKLYKRLVRMRTINDTGRRWICGGCFGHKARRLDQYEKKFEDIEANVRLEQSSVMAKEVPAAFVSFNSRYSAAIASLVRQGTNPTEWLTETAPEPRDVYWPFFFPSFFRQWINKVLAAALVIVITILFLIPVFLVQGFANLEQLETWFPFLKGFLSLTVVSQVVTGYLPSLILQLFLSFIPPVMIMISSMQGCISHSQIELSTCSKLLWFTTWNIFFANVFSGTVFYQFGLVFEPKNIPSVLAEAVPGQASFFISYVVTSGWTSTSSELFRLFPLISSFINGTCFGKNEEKVNVPSIPYHSEISRIVLFGLIGVVYFFLAPLIVPFVLVYYCLGYIIYRNQLLNVYEPKFETGGKFWPKVHNWMIFSLMLMHVIAIGIFSLKKLPTASILCLPLPVLTLLFNDYCQKQFQPAFHSYSVETLISKDKENENDSSMGDFFEKLASAYQNPVLTPIRRASGNSPSTPLLQAATEV